MEIFSITIKPIILAMLINEALILIQYILIDSMVKNKILSFLITILLSFILLMIKN